MNFDGVYLCSDVIEYNILSYVSPFDLFNISKVNLLLLKLSMINMKKYWIHLYYYNKRIYMSIDIKKIDKDKFKDEYEDYYNSIYTINDNLLKVYKYYTLKQISNIDYYRRFLYDIQYLWKPDSDHDIYFNGCKFLYEDFSNALRASVDCYIFYI